MAILRDPTSDREYPLSGPRHLLGRGPDCDIRLTDPLISSRHAVIARDGDHFVIEDLRSRNGTLVNGTPVAGPVRLRPGDKVQLAGYSLVLVAPDSAPFALTETPTEAEPAVVRSLELSSAPQLEVSPAAKLRAVLEISRNLSNALKLQDVLPKILESLFALFPQTDRGFVLLREQASGRLVPKAVRHRQNPNDVPAISRTVLDYAVKTGRAVLTADAGHDDRFDASQSIRVHRLRSVMCVPLLGPSGDCLGVIQLDTQKQKPFTQDDLDVLAIAAMQAARAVEMAKLHLELRELEAATQIQRSFLPAERPRAPGLRFFDFYAAAGQVGGDYYDYVRLSGDRLAVTIGDVAGKGVTAALLMARLSAAARFCLATEPVPAAAIQQLNTAVTRACGDARFITLVLAVIDLNTFGVTVVNAGHMPPLRRRADGTVEDVGVGTAGIPLGVFDRPYQETATTAEPGDLWVMCTDGVTEARDPAGELYGAERLRAALRAAPADAESAGQAILADVRQFAAGRPAADDLTLVCFSRELSPSGLAPPTASPG